MQRAPLERHWTLVPLGREYAHVIAATPLSPPPYPAAQPDLDRVALIVVLLEKGGKCVHSHPPPPPSTSTSDTRFKRHGA